MKVLTSTYTIFFPQILNIREHFFEFEKALSDSFIKPFMLEPLPDDAPVEIPRIRAVSAEGNRTLNITPQSAQIIFNNAKNESIDQLLDGIKNICGSINSTISEIIGEGNFLFSGLSTVVEIPVPDPVSLLREKFVAAKINSDTQCELYDALFRISVVYESDYFINIEMSNRRYYMGVPSGLSIVGLKERPQQLGVMIDINDRRAFNITKDYRTDVVHMDKIMSISALMVNEKIEKFINSGELELKHE